MLHCAHASAGKTALLLGAIDAVPEIKIGICCPRVEYQRMGMKGKNKMFLHFLY